MFADLIVHSSRRLLNDLFECEQMFGRIEDRVLRLLGRCAPPVVVVRGACLLVNVWNKTKGFGDQVRCVSRCERACAWWSSAFCVQ